MFLVCQILITSLFNRSTTKKAKQCGTVAFHESPSLGRIFDISLHSEISVESKFLISGKNRSWFLLALCEFPGNAIKRN